MDKKTEQLYRDALAALPPVEIDRGITVDNFTQPAGFGESDFTTAVKVGALGLGESVNRIGAALGSEGAQRRADELAVDQQFYSSRIAAPQQFSEVDSASGLGGYIVQGLGKSLPEMALAAIPGGIAGAAARRSALAAGKTTAQAVAAGGAVGANVGAAATIPSGVGQALSSQFEQSGEYGLGAAVPLGLGYAALSRFGIEGGAASAAGRGALSPAMEAATKAGAVGKAALQTGAVEAGQELAQDELVTQFARKSVDAEYDMLSGKAMAERGEALAGGFFLGGTIGGGAEIFKSRKIAPDAQEPTDLMGEAPRTPRAPVAPEAPVNTMPSVDRVLEGELMPPLRPEGPRGLPMPEMMGLPAPQEPPPTMYAGSEGDISTRMDAASGANDTLANRAAQAQGVNPAMQNWNGQQPLPAPVDFVAGGQGVQPANAVMPEMQNQALEQRLDPAMLAQQGQQPQGEPTAEREAQGNRAMVRKFLYQNRIKPGSKIGQMALASKSLDELQQTILQAADKAGNEKTFAPLNRAFTALTGVDIDTFIEQREVAQPALQLEPQGEADAVQPSTAPVSQPVDVQSAQAPTPVEPSQPSGVAPVASVAPKVGRVGDNAEVAGLDVREDVPAVPDTTNTDAALTTEPAMPKGRIKDVLDIIAAKGGLSIDQARQEGIDPAVFESKEGKRGGRRVFRKEGMTFDAAAELVAQEAGFDNLRDANALLNAVQETLAGRAVSAPAQVDQAMGKVKPANQLNKTQVNRMKIPALAEFAENNLDAQTPEVRDTINKRLIAAGVKAAQKKAPTPKAEQTKDDTPLDEAGVTGADADAIMGVGETEAAPKKAVEPKKKAVEPKKAAEAEAKQAVKAQRKNTAEAKELFAENADGMKDRTGAGYDFDALPPELQDIWLESPRSIADFDYVISLENHRRIIERADKSFAKRNPNADLSDNVDPRYTRTYTPQGTKIDQSLIDAMSEGRTLDAAQLLKSLIGTNRTRWISQLAERMLQRGGSAVLSTYKVRLGYPRDENGNLVDGEINHRERMITLNADGATRQAALHELFHAMVDGRLTNNPEAQTKLRDVMDRLRERLPASDLVDNAFENTHEFINYYFTSPEFAVLVNTTGPEAAGFLSEIVLKAKMMVESVVRLMTGRAPQGGMFGREINSVLTELLKDRAIVDTRKGPRFKRAAATQEGLAFEAIMGRARTLHKSNEAKALMNKIKRSALGILTNDQIADIFNKVPGIRAVLNAISAQEQMKNRILKSADPIFRGMKAFITANRDMGDVMVNTAYKASEYGIWPDRPLTFESQPWLFRNDKNEDGDTVKVLIDEKTQQRYDELATAYDDKLNDEGRAVFQSVFEHHTALRDLEANTLLDAQTKGYLPEIVKMLQGQPQLAEVQSLLSQLRDLEYESKEYNAVRTRLKQLRREINPQTGHIIMEFADRIGEIRKARGLPGPYLPLMRRGAFVYVRRSGELQELEAKIVDLGERVAEAARSDKTSIALNNLKEELQGLKKTYDAVRIKLGGSPANSRFKKQLADAETAYNKKQGEVKLAEQAVAESEYETLRAEQAGMRKQIQRLQEQEQHYAVVFSDSEAELMNLRDEDANQFGEGGTVLPRADIGERAGLGKRYLDSMTAAATKNMDPQAAAQIRAMASELYLRLAPEGSSAKRRLERRGVSGYSTDMVQNFMEHTRSVASNVAKLTHAPEVYDSMVKLREEKTSEALDVYNELYKRQQLTMNQENTPIQDALTKFGAFFFLGISPAFVILNATQNAMITYPFLGAKFGFQRSGSEMLKVAAQIKDLYGLKKLVGKGALTYEFDYDKANLNDGQREMLDRIQELGVLNFSQVVELAGDGTGVMDTINQYAFHFPHHTEVMNRLISSLTAYNLAMEAGLGQEKATEAAVEATIHTHGNYNPDNKPRYFRQIYKPLTLFKSFAQMMAYMTYRSMWLAVKGEKPEVRNEARKRLMGIAVMHQLFAGAVGLPGAGLVGMLAELMADDDEPIEWKGALRDTLKEFAGEDVGEFLYAGFSRQLLGGDLSSRVGNPDVFTLGINLRMDPNKSGGDAMIAKVTEVAGPLVGVLKNIGDGSSAIVDGNFIDGLSKGMPKGVADVFKGIKQLQDGDMTDRGVLRQEFGAYEAFIQMIGINPASKARLGEQRTTDFIVDTKRDNVRNTLTREMTKARMTGTSQSEIRRRIEQYNKANPDNRITPRALQSALQRARQDQKEADEMRK